jgi:IS5 family transposase
VLRQFCRVYVERVPDDTTLLRWANLIGPQTLEQLNERVVELARSRKVTRGRKLRVDSAVVEATVHHPTASGILGAGVRVLSRLLRRAKTLVGETPGRAKTVFPSHNRRVRRLAQQMHRVARRKWEEAVAARKGAHTKLLRITQHSQAQARSVCGTLRDRSEGATQRLVHRFETYLPRIDQAMIQTIRRVIDGEIVPAKEKIVSLFEPHTQIIVRHKVGKAVEFGRKLWLEEVENGIIGGYRVPDESGQDYAYFAGSLQAHKHRFGHPPDLVAGDRGVFSAANERVARAAGVKRVVLPGNGTGSPERRKHERERWFRRGFRFRAGIEGRISVLRRCYGLARCPDHGPDGMERYVGWGILTHNLVRIARAQVAR